MRLTAVEPLARSVFYGKSKQPPCQRRSGGVHCARASFHAVPTARFCLIRPRFPVSLALFLGNARLTLVALHLAARARSRARECRRRRTECLRRRPRAGRVGSSVRRGYATRAPRQDGHARRPQSGRVERSRRALGEVQNGDPWSHDPWSLHDARGQVVCSAKAPVASRLPSKTCARGEGRVSPASRLLRFGNLRARSNRLVGAVGNRAGV
jgi:hypothetical protein